MKTKLALCLAAILLVSEVQACGFGTGLYGGGGFQFGQQFSQQSAQQSLLQQILLANLLQSSGGYSQQQFVSAQPFLLGGFGGGFNTFGGGYGGGFGNRVVFGSNRAFGGNFGGRNRGFSFEFNNGNRGLSFGFRR